MDTKVTHRFKIECIVVKLMDIVNKDMKLNIKFK